MTRHMRSTPSPSCFDRIIESVCVPLILAYSNDPNFFSLLRRTFRDLSHLLLHTMDDPLEVGDIGTAQIALTYRMEKKYSALYITRHYNVDHFIKIFKIIK